MSMPAFPYPKLHEVVKALADLLQDCVSQEAIRKIIFNIQSMRLDDDKIHPFLIEQITVLRSLRNDAMRDGWAHQITNTPYGGSVQPSTEPVLRRFDGVIRLVEQFAERYYPLGTHA